MPCKPHIVGIADLHLLDIPEEAEVEAVLDPAEAARHTAQDVAAHRQRTRELAPLAWFGVRLMEALGLRFKTMGWPLLDVARLHLRLMRRGRQLIALELRLSAAFRMSAAQRLAERARCAAVQARAEARRVAGVARLGGLPGAAWDRCGALGDPLRLPSDRTVSQIAALACRELGITPDMPRWPAALIATHVKARDIGWAVYGVPPAGAAEAAGALAAGVAKAGGAAIVRRFRGLLDATSLTPWRHQAARDGVRPARPPGQRPRYVQPWDWPPLLPTG